MLWTLSALHTNGILGCSIEPGFSSLITTQCAPPSFAIAITKGSAPLIPLSGFCGLGYFPMMSRTMRWTDSDSSRKRSAWDFAHRTSRECERRRGAAPSCRYHGGAGVSRPRGEPLASLRRRSARRFPLRGKICGGPLLCRGASQHATHSRGCSACARISSRGEALAGPVSYLMHGHLRRARERGAALSRDDLRGPGVRDRCAPCGVGGASCCRGPERRRMTGIW